MKGRLIIVLERERHKIKERKKMLKKSRKKKTKLTIENMKVIAKKNN